MSACLAFKTCYAEAVFAKDASRLSALYAPDVQVFDAWSPNPLGLEEWRRSLEQWLGSLGDTRVRVEFEDIRSEERADTAWLSASVSYTALDAQGAERRSLRNRLSWGLVKRDDLWRIAHEHTSVPVDFESQKAVRHQARP